MSLKTNNTYHKSVLVNEVLEYLAPGPDKIYIDATFGGGGHTRAILDHEPSCRVIAVDWDMQAIEKNAPELQEQYGDRIKILWGNFALLYRLLKKENTKHVDGILADFGTSQYQIFEKHGFSFATDTPLDMRMSPAHQRMTAADILNHYRESRLIKILREYGEEPYAKKIARTIIEARTQNKIKTTQELVTLIDSAIPAQVRKARKTHPATKTFQALRIEVNNELENIKSFLAAALSCLNTDGRLVCISFHSLEDRIVKNFFKDHTDKLEILTPKPVTAQPDEIQDNPSSRSAKLRAALKLL